VFASLHLEAKKAVFVSLASKKGIFCFASKRKGKRSEAHAKQILFRFISLKSETFLK